MPPEIAVFVELVALMVLAPGLCLVALAKYGYRKVPSSRRRMRKDTVAQIGWTYIALACAFFLYIQMILGGSNGPGGLGSMGNPLGVVVVLGFTFVVGPVATIVFVAVVVGYMIARNRESGESDG